MSNPQDPYQQPQPGSGPLQPTAQSSSARVGYGSPGQDGSSGRYGAPGPYSGPGQQPATGPFGLPGQPPPPQSRRKLWTILGIAAGILLLIILGAVILVNIVNGATNQARGLADGFTRLVLAGDSSTAYDDYLDPALKEQLSKEDFIAGVKTLEMDDTCTPAYNDVKAATENGIKSADIAGLITCDGEKKIDLVYRFEGTDQLKMVNIKLKPRL